MQSYHKYHNKKTTISGIDFDSKKEAERYVILKMLEKNGTIKNLQMQKKFLIVPKEGNNTRARYYIADFVYEENGKTIVEDVKSAITKRNPVYSLKKALMLFWFPDFVFREYE